MKYIINLLTCLIFTGINATNPVSEVLVPNGNRAMIRDRPILCISSEDGQRIFHVPLSRGEYNDLHNRTISREGTYPAMLRGGTDKLVSCLKLDNVAVEYTLLIYLRKQVGHIEGFNFGFPIGHVPAILRNENEQNRIDPGPFWAQAQELARQLNQAAAIQARDATNALLKASDQRNSPLSEDIATTIQKYLQNEPLAKCLDELVKQYQDGVNQIDNFLKQFENQIVPLTELSEFIKQIAPGISK